MSTFTSLSMKNYYKIYKFQNYIQDYQWRNVWRTIFHSQGISNMGFFLGITTLIIKRITCKVLTSGSQTCKLSTHPNASHYSQNFMTQHLSCQILDKKSPITKFLKTVVVLQITLVMRNYSINKFRNHDRVSLKFIILFPI